MNVITQCCILQLKIIVYIFKWSKRIVSMYKMHLTCQGPADEMLLPIVRIITSLFYYLPNIYKTN